MKSRPYIINNKKDGERLHLIGANELPYDEAWLQELLRQHPDLLPTAEIEPKYAPLVPIGRETGTSSGPIDNLFISPQGYLVVVETKLWRNPQARREVLAQVIDYGAALAQWRFDELNQAVRTYTRRYTSSENNITDWVEQYLGPIEDGRDYFEDQVSKNLRLGRFLTLIVGDRIHDALIDMLDYSTNKIPHLAMDIVLVELASYKIHSDQDWPLLVVPNLVARTKVVERSIVQINLVKDDYTVEAIQEKATPDKRGHRLQDEDDYWDLLKEKSPKSVDPARNLIDRFRDIDGVVIETSTSSLVTRLLVQDSGERATLFFIDKSGNVEAWPGTIRTQIERGGISGEVVGEYETALNHILQRRDWRCVKSVVYVDAELLFNSVNRLIHAVQSAKREIE